jgi:uncharacterized protein
MKYLLLIALVAAVWWAWGKRGRPAAPTAAKRPAAPAEDMVSCAHCGVNMPESESLRDGDLRFCSEAHRQARGEHGRRP